MSPRAFPKRWLHLVLGFACLGVGLASFSGCDPRQMAYFLQPFEPTIPAPGPDLKGQRVVVIVKAIPGALYDYPTLDRELARELVTVLREGVKKIELVDLDKVYVWDQAHPTWSDAADLAEAFDADKVISIEVEHFQVQDPSSPGLFEGRSVSHLRMVDRSYPLDDKKKPMKDLPKECRIVYENDRETMFPIRGPIPASSEVTHTAFKTKFLRLAATELSWFFVPHASGDNIQDVSFD